MRFSFSCCLRIGRFEISLPAASAAWRVMRRIAPAYGRRAAIRCSARRRRAAATISIARVILRMFLTESIRCLTSRWEAAMGSGGARRRLLLGLLGVLVLAALGLGARRAREVAPAAVLVPAVVVRIGVGAARADALLLARRLVAVLERMALLVEVVAEVVGEVAHALAHGLLRLLRPVALADLAEQ